MASRAARIIAWIAALAVVTVAGIWALLPWFVSSDVVRSAIERELTDMAGQSVVVGGDVDIDLFPVPTARLYDLSVPGENGSGGRSVQTLLEVDMVEVAIPFSSVIWRDPGFSQFRLVRPVVRVDPDLARRYEPGRRQGRLARALSDLARAEIEDDSLPELASLASGIGTITIENGAIQFLGMITDAPEQITALSGTVSWPRFDTRLSATLSGIWRGAAFRQTTEIDQAILLFAERTTGVRTAFSSEILEYTFDGRLSVGEAPFAEGAMTFASASLRQALDWLQAGIEPGRAISEISFQGNLRGDDKRARFEDVNMVLQGSSGSGVLEFAYGDDAKPSLTATLDFLDLDILSYLSAFTGFPRNLAAVDDAVSTAVIDQLDVDLRLSAARATAGAVALTDVAAVTQIRNGEAVFDLADATGFGGRLQGRFGVGRKDGVLHSEFGFSADAVDTALLADALGLDGLFPRGRASGSLAIQSPAEIWSDLFRKAEGKIELRVTEGQIAGFGRLTLLGEGGGQRFFRLQDTDTSETFEDMLLEASVGEGVITIDRCTIDYPGGEVELNGVIPYGTASVALTTVATRLDEAGEPMGPAVQHFIGGAWSNPYAMPVLLPGFTPGPPG